MKSNTEPNVKIAKPKTKSFTRPNISESLPKVTKRVAVIILKPIKSQRRYTKEPGAKTSRCIPLKIAGMDIKIMVVFTADMNTPIVVFESATHLYCISLVL